MATQGDRATGRHGDREPGRQGRRDAVAVAFDLSVGCGNGSAVAPRGSDALRRPSRGGCVDAAFSVPPSRCRLLTDVPPIGAPPMGMA